MAALPQRNPRPAPDALESALARIAARLRHQHQATLALRGANLGLTLDLILALAARFAFWPDAVPFAATLCCLPVLGAIIGSLWGKRRLISPQIAADTAEMRLPLKERLSSALEFNAPVSAPPLLLLQHDDAAAHARALTPSEAAPFHMPREFWLTLPLLFLLALALWLPLIPGLETTTGRADRHAVQSAGAALLKSARTLEQRALIQHNMAAQKRAHNLAKLGQRMAQGKLTRAQSLAALSEQQRQLAAQSDASPAQNPGNATRTLAQPGSHSAATPAASGHNKATTTPPAKPVPAPTKPKAPPHPAPSAPQHSPHPSPTPSGMGNNHAPTSGASSSNAVPNKPSAPASGSPDKPSSPADNSPTAAQDAHDRQETQQALDNARRQMTGQGPPKPAASGSQQPGHSGSSGPPRPGNNPASAGAPTPGSAGNKSGSGTQPGRTPSQLGGHPGAPGSPAPGGGAGKADKYALGRPLSPSPASHGPTVYLGPPRPGDGQTVPTGRAHGLPTAPAGGSHVPFAQALPRYRAGTEAALDKQNVPPSYRSTVRNYFNSLPKSPP